jgi:putative holliday junction resolvase
VSNSTPRYLLGLDVGDARIGVAVASSIARLPRPLKHLQHTTNVFKDIQELVERESINHIVVGLPRNQSGQETAQSQKVRDFAEELEQRLKRPVYFADESLSSVRAEALKRALAQPDISTDSLAACYILEEFLGHGEKA